ncbi:MAG: carboxypeptidase-like regulatory domain-containing protein [Treponema sp.]|nr:carboxypeptidase-like regulatory domain-containing protein [Treponema sp.]
MFRKIINSGFCLSVLFLLLFFQGCASKKGYSGKIDLCGFVVDENNHAVSNFIIRCKKKSGFGINEYSALSLDNGLFTINDLSSGEYVIYGEKNGYAKLSEFTIQTQAQKIICIQVCSIDNVLNNVEKQILLGEKQKALELLEEIKFEQNSPEEFVVQSYKSIIEKI